MMVLRRRRQRTPEWFKRTARRSAHQAPRISMAKFDAGSAAGDGALSGRLRQPGFFEKCSSIDITYLFIVFF
jgi:hypothetical protein